MTALAFIDTETTGLDPEQHEIWEVGLIMRSVTLPAAFESVPEEGTEDYWFRWFLPVDLSRADPEGLRISGYHDRHPHGDNAPRHEQDYTKPVMTSNPVQIHCSCGASHFSDWDGWGSIAGRVEDPELFSHTLQLVTLGAHLAGAVVSFDEKRLEKLLRANGVLPAWHYHLIDVENLAVGYLAARRPGMALIGEGYPDLSLPWDSDSLSLACGVKPPTDERHTAMGDARWAKALYDAIVGAA